MAGLSCVLVAASLVTLALLGQLNMGIDFAGGTQLVIRFRDRPEVEELRALLAEAGMPDAQIQRFGGEDLNEVMIKTPLKEGREEGMRDAVVQALEQRFDSGGTGVDLNQQGSLTLASMLLRADPDDRVRLGDDDAARHYDQVADRVMQVRRDEGLIASWDRLEGVAGISNEVLATLEQQAHLGPFSVVAAENVGPQIGSELRTKGVLAVVFSLVGMLAYIWYRFELRFGLGAVAAALHDVIVALGFYAFLGYEFNLTTIAAFLTVVGYSVNDSVVIFDRVRENLRRTRREPLIAVINTSLNQTLSRTVLTSGTTLLAVGTLFFFGGEVLRGFSFVLLLGVIVGTYSSIFVAAPVVLLWERFVSR